MSCFKIIVISQQHFRALTKLDHVVVSETTERKYNIKADDSHSFQDFSSVGVGVESFVRT